MAMNFPKGQRAIAFDRATAFPLDANAYFESLVAAKAAVKPAEEVGSKLTAYYFGQQIAVVENGIATLYIIEKATVETDVDARGYEGQLKEVGSKTLGDEASITLDSNGVLSIYGFADAGNKCVPYKDAETGKIVWGTVEGLIPDAVVPIGDNETILVSVAENDSTKRVVSLLGKEGAADKAVLRKHVSPEGTVSYGWDVIYDKAEVDALLANKVNVEEGKSLVSDTEIARLANMKDGANKVEASEQNGYIKIDGTETKVYEEVANTVHDADYKHITVTNGSVSDGINTFTKYDDKALAGRVASIEADYLRAADKTELQGNIDKKQDELAFEGEYNKASNKVATAAWVTAEIGKMKHWSYEVLDQLPEIGAGEEYKIYLVKKGADVSGYKEYIFLPAVEGRDARFEEIGDTDIDLSNYATKGEVAAITERLDAEGTGLAALAARIKVYEDAKAGYDAAVTKVAGIEEGAQVNKIEQIKLNGAVVEPAEKVVDLGNLATADALNTASGKIAALETKVGDENSGLVKDVAGIKADYLTSTDKTELQGNIDKKVTAEEGKRLMTDAEGTKLEGIAAGAQVNVIEKIKLNGEEVTPVDKLVDLGSLATTEEVNAASAAAAAAKTAADNAASAVTAEQERASGVEAGLRNDVDLKLAKADLAGEVAKLEISAGKVKVGAEAGETLSAKLETIDTEIAKIADKADTTYVNGELAKKQAAITAEAKLSADLVEDGTNNKVFTAAEKTKLAAVEEGAQANKLEGIQVAGNDIELADKKANIVLGDGLKYNAETKKIELDLSNIILNGGNASLQ